MLKLTHFRLVDVSNQFKKRVNSIAKFERIQPNFGENLSSSED
jgi:hypothetical protein